VGCVTDPNLLGFLQAQIVFCNPTVLAREVGAPARIEFTALPAKNPGLGGSDTFVGVLTVVDSAGTPHVVDLLTPLQVSVPGYLSNGSPPSATPCVAVSEHSLAASLGGKDVHVSIGPKNYFPFKIGDVFVPNLNVMLRTDFVVTKPAGAPSFAVSVASLAGTVVAGTRPTAGILVQNTGTAAGPDTVTGVLMSPTGVQVAAFSSASTGSIAAGGSRTVKVTLESPIPGSYAGKTLTATFADGHGNVAHASLTVTSSSSGTGGGTSGGGGGSTGTGGAPGNGTSTTPPTSSTAIATTPLLIALSLGVVGIGAIWLGSRG